MKRFWMNESGALLSFELLLLLVIVVIGVSVGMVILRDAVVTDFQNVAAAVNSLDPGYAWSGLAYAGTMSGAYVNGSTDATAFAAGAGTIVDAVAGAAPTPTPLAATPALVTP